MSSKQDEETSTDFLAKSCKNMQDSETKYDQEAIANKKQMSVGKHYIIILNNFIDYAALFIHS